MMEQIRSKAPENTFLSIQQLKKLFDYSPDAICFFDADGVIISVSKASYKIWGYYPEEMINRSCYEFMVNDEVEKTKKASINVINGKASHNFRNVYRHKNGNLVYVSWSGHWDKEKNLMVCIARDVSKEKAEEDTRLALEKKLQKQNKQMKQILERIRDGFFALDQNWNIIYANPQVDEILKLKGSDYLNKNLLTSFPELVGSGIEQQYIKAKTFNVPVHFEAYMNTFETWFSIDAYPSSTGLSIFFRNIGDEKKREEERQYIETKLQSQNQMMVEVLEQMQDGFLTIDRNGKILYWNKEAEYISEVKKEYVLGKILWELYPNFKETTYYQLYQELMTHGVPVHRQILSPFSNRWVELHAYLTEKGISCFFRDITKKKKAEEELRKLSLIAKETVNYVAICDKERKILWINDACSKISGYSLDEAIGKYNWEIFDGPQTDQETINFVKERVEQQLPFRIEVLNYKKNGDTYWSDVSCQPVFDENGKLLYFFSIATDVTDRKLLEVELQEQQKSMNAAIIATQEKERAIVGQELHDNVNQVLTTVKLYQELCLSGMGNTEEILNKSICLLQTSINEIRNLSKRLSAPTLGNIKMKESIVDLIDSIAETNKISINFTEKCICDKDLQITPDMHLGIYRILQEHLTNILKHAEATQVDVSLSCNYEAVYLKVHDNGKGFNTKAKRKGIGIANMMMRAESLNGKLNIISAPGTGCKLSLTCHLK